MNLMQFREWVEYDRKKKEKEKKNVRSASQSNQENSIVHHQGQTAGADTKEYSTVVYDFTKSKWEDYRGSN